MTTAVLLATVPAAPGVPAATLPLDGTTPLDRLLSQLHGRAGAVHVLTRPALAGGLPGAGVTSSADACADLVALADLLDSAPPGPVLLAGAEVVLSEAVLDVLLADPRPAVTVLVGAPGLSWPLSAPGGVVTAAASPAHRVSAPDASALEVLRVPQGRRAEVAAVARAAAGGLRGVALLPDAVPSDDALALLLVALARSGHRVRTVPLRGFAWARALDEDRARAGAVRLAEVDEVRARMDAAVKPDDGFFGTFFVSPYSRHLARAAANAGLTPNQVTVTSMVLGVLAALLFAQGDRLALVAGALVLHGAFTLDCVDGQLARYSGQFSSLGAYLDAVSDRIKEYLVYAGLAVGAGRHGDDVWTLAATALLLQTAHHALQFSWPGGEQAAVVPREGPLSEPELGGGRSASGSARVAVAVSERTQSRTALRWAKRIVQFPIGERFAVITLGAALGGPRVMFSVFLVCVSLALAWSLTGRLLRSVSR